MAYNIFFQVLISHLLKKLKVFVNITAMTNHVFIYFSAVQIYVISYIHLEKKDSQQESGNRTTEIDKPSGWDHEEKHVLIGHIRYSNMAPRLLCQN